MQMCPVLKPLHDYNLNFCHLLFHFFGNELLENLEVFFFVAVLACADTVRPKVVDYEQVVAV